MCLLSGAIGPRPVQLADLKVGDYRTERQEGALKHILAVPRAKLRGQPTRTEFTDRELVDDVARIVEAQIAAVRVLAEAEGRDVKDAPLFSSGHRTADGDLLHMTSHEAANRIAATMEGLGVRSERTGAVINVTAMRARRSVGTRAAQEGHSLAVIVILLDHFQTRTARVYIETRMEMLERLDEKLAVYLAPMAQRFRGTLVQPGQPGGDGRHVLGVVQEGDRPQDLGECGKHSFCALSKPLACYTCTLFQAWVDGPHEAVLDGLLAKRERQAQCGSLRVAEALDDTIMAVAEVVRLCREAVQSSGRLAHG